MKRDKTICQVRKAAKLPCTRCEFYQKCPEIKGETPKNVVEEPKKIPKQAKKAKKEEKEPESTIVIPEYIKKQEKKEKRIRKSFTEQDMEIMRNTEIPSRMAATLINHHVNSVYRWRKRNRIQMPEVSYSDRFRSNSWTEAELEVVRNADLSTKEVQAIIQRSENAIKHRRRILGIRRQKEK